MPQFLHNLFSVDSYMPHGFCLHWDSNLVLLFCTANICIALAYFAIPIALYYFVRQRKDLVYSWMFNMFAAFITACGLTHFMKILTLYKPYYWLEACIDACTGAISLATAILLWPLIPKALALRNPAELAKVNEQLQQQIVARERMENTLKRREKLFELLVFHVKEYGIFMLDPFGYVVTWNVGAERITGYNAEDIKGKHLSQFYPPDKADNSRLEIETAKRTGRFEELDWRVRKDGSKFWAYVVLSPIYDDLGDLLGFANVIRDLTEEKLAEDALKQRTEELAQSNRELELARDAALEASHLKSAFVANISHELRTPLSGILGMNELLLQSQLDEEQHDMAKAVDDSAHSLLSILNDILDLSKIEAGKMNLEYIPFNPISVVEDCAHVLSVGAKQKSLKLNTDIDAHIPNSLYGDPLRLHQVLLNFVSNAVKFTSQGSITIKVSIESEDRNNTIIKFSVTDTGIGLSEDDRKYLFMPFTQVDSSTTRKYGGTGLGLVISKRIVELMGGEIGVVSTKGEGSTFWFAIPFKYASQETLSSSMPDLSISNISPSKIVLVVEDNLVMQKLVLQQLTNFGIKAHGVADGKIALEALNQNHYDLILMDCQLPDLDGFETTKLIRQQEKFANKTPIPIIAMTASAMRGDQEKCFESGMDDYMSKPYTLDQLKQKLSHWLIK